MSENDYEKTELATVKSARFGLDDRTYTVPMLSLGLEFSSWGVTCAQLVGKELKWALKVWECDDIAKLVGRTCEVHVTGPGSSLIRFVRAKS